MVVLHLLACGVLRHGVTGVSGPGMVINPFQVLEEIRDLERRKLLRGDVVISDRAHVLLPLHEVEDAWEDDLRNRTDPKATLGTTRRGVGPAYEDRYGRWGIRMGDLSRPAGVKEALTLLYARKAHLPNLPPIDDLAARLAEVGGQLAPFIRSTETMLWDALARGENVLIEGAQSALLDIDFGTYPFVTSSHPTSAGALMGSGIPPTELDSVVGVSKVYCTRVGAGPFPTEESGPRGEYLQRVGGERGATTGRARRCGWLDLVLLRYAARLNGFTSLALSKVDVLGGMESVPVCVQVRDARRDDGARRASPPGQRPREGAAGLRASPGLARVPRAPPGAAAPRGGHGPTGSASPIPRVRDGRDRRYLWNT